MFAEHLHPHRPRPNNGGHARFAARSPEAVRAFHRVAAGNRATEIGGPGPRPDHTPTHHAAFAPDPDGRNTGAVFHLPESN